MRADFDYSVRVKNGAGWRAFDRIRLMISVGQPYHEGRKLKAVIDWINRNPGIRQVHVSVNDLLQRHNLIAAGLSEDRASATALAEGSLWIARNENILSGIKVPVSITRWQDWLSHADYVPASTALAAYANADILFGEAIHTDARTLAGRKIKRGETVANPDRLIAHSHDYLTEELSAFAIQSRELPAAEVYPGSNLASAQYLIGKKLPDPIQPLASRHFTRIDFAHINRASTNTPKASRQLDYT